MRLQEEEVSFFDQGFRPVRFPLIKRPFVFCVEITEGGPLLGKTLQSIFSQCYEPFRVICLDREGTWQPPQASIQVLQKDETVSCFENLKRTAAHCADEEIMVVLKEGEFLAHEWVLCRLNQYYADPDLWLTFSQFREFPSYRLGARPFLFPELPLKTFLIRFFRPLPEAEILDAAESHFQHIPEILMLAEKNDA